VLKSKHKEFWEGFSVGLLWGCFRMEPEPVMAVSASSTVQVSTAKSSHLAPLPRLYSPFKRDCLISRFPHA
jgi:hypothetical protein